MATSSEFKTSNTYVKYKITVTEGTPNTTDNSSPVTVSVKFYRTNTGYSTYGTGTVYCKINGTKYSATVSSSQKITNSGIVLFEKTVTIPHDSDGGKTLNVSAWISLNTPLSSSEQGFSVTLTTIARASQPSCITWPNHTQNVGDFGTEISIHMNRKSSEFKHVVRYEFGTQKGTIATMVDTGVRWTIPLELMDLIPNTTSGSGTIYVDTYAWDGGGYSELVGTKKCGFTATVPSTVKPSVSIDGRLTVITDGGVDYGKPVQGLSKIKVEPVITTAYSSPIKTCTITVDGVTYSATTITSNVLRNSGDSPVTVTVTDQRGRSNSDSYVMEVLPYSKPRVTDLKVHRVDEDGNEDIQGAWVNVTFSAIVSDMSSQNTASYSVGYKKTTEQEYTTVSLDALNNNFSVSKHVYKFPAETTSSYDVEVSASDRHSSGYRSTSVSTAFSLMDWHNSGTGIAFGKVAEDPNLMDVGLPLRLLGGIKPIEIAANTDLNSITTPGIYRCSLSDTAATLVNCPTQIAFVMEVLPNIPATQRITEYQQHSSLSLFMRNYYDNQNEWGLWYELVPRQNRLANAVSLLTETSYTFASDGYLVLRANWNVNSYVNCSLYGPSDDTRSISLTASSGSATGLKGNPTDTIFVRKGMRVKNIARGGVNGEALEFHPLY